MEDAELVPYAVTERGNLQSRHGVEKARGQAAEAAVSQAGLVLTREHPVEIEAELGHGLTHLLIDSEVHQVVAEMGSHQEFGREIRDGARAQRGVGRSGAYPAVQHPVSHRVGESHVVVVLRRQRRCLALNTKKIVQKRVLEGVLAQRDAVVLRGIIRGRSQSTHVHVSPAWGEASKNGSASSVQIREIAGAADSHAQP